MAITTQMVLLQQLCLLIGSFIFSRNYFSVAQILCPDLILIEMGNQSAIRCNITGKSVFGVYWYRGSTMTTSPLVRLENGKPGGSAYNSSDYDISSSGDLIIKHATVAHEDTYTLVVYFLDRTHDSANVSIDVKVTPDPPCPSVTDCYTCGKCNFNITDTPAGDILCGISISRPQIPIYWTIKSRTGISFVIHRPIKIKERNSDSWSTSVRISYESYLCGAEAVVQCIAQDHYRLLRHSSTTVRLFKAECGEDLNEVPAFTKVIIPVVISIGVLAIVLIIVTVVGCHLKKASTSYTKVMYKGSKETSPSTSLTPEVLQFISCLKESYIKNGTVKVLPDANLMPPDVIYPPCEFTITNRDGLMESISSNNLLTDDYIRKRFLITKYPECDLNMYVKQVVQQWIQEDKNEFSLILISLQDLKKDMSVANVVKENILMESDLSKECIEELIKQHTCLVVLHGVHDLIGEGWKNTTPREQDYNAESEKRTSCTNVENEITLDELLSGTIHQHYYNVHVWITACETNEEVRVCAKIDSTVQIKGCSTYQMKEYISKTCTFYTQSKETSRTSTLCEEVSEVCESEDRKLSPISSETTVEIISPAEIQFDSNTQILNNATEESTGVQMGPEGEDSPLLTKFSANTSKKDFDEIVMCVYEFFEEREIFHDFIGSPYLLMLLIHIVVKSFLPKITEKGCVPITSTAMLVEALVICLKDINYVDGCKKHYPPEEFNTLLAKVGEVAFQFLLHDSAPNVECLNLGDEYLDYVNTGLAIGLFLSPPNTGIVKEGYLSKSSTVFCHNYIQNYFTAYSINEQPKHFNTFITQLQAKKHDRIIGILKFSALLNKKLFKDLCETLRGKRSYDYLITCLYEPANNDISDSIIRKISLEDLHIVHLGSKINREALKSFCRRCCEMNLTLKSITFTESCNLSFLKTFELPNIKKIQFARKKFHDEEFASLIVWVNETKKIRSLWFLECNIPEEVTTMSQKEFQQLSESELEVCRKKRTDDSTRSTLQFKSGKWNFVFDS